MAGPPQPQRAGLHGHPPWELRFIGIVGFGDRGHGTVEMIYGIAPRWRGRGLASRAARLAARWALSLPGVYTVELRIDRDNTASQRVAVNAGFTPTGTVTQFVPRTGQTVEDLRYVLEEHRSHRRSCPARSVPGPDPCEPGPARGE